MPCSEFEDRGRTAQRSTRRGARARSEASPPREPVRRTQVQESICIDPVPTTPVTNAPQFSKSNALSMAKPLSDSPDYDSPPHRPDRGDQHARSIGKGKGKEVQREWSPDYGPPSDSEPEEQDVRSTRKNNALSMAKPLSDSPDDERPPRRSEHEDQHARRNDKGKGKEVQREWSPDYGPPPYSDAEVQDASNCHPKHDSPGLSNQLASSSLAGPSSSRPKEPEHQDIPMTLDARTYTPSDTSSPECLDPSNSKYYDEDKKMKGYDCPETRRRPRKEPSPLDTPMTGSFIDAWYASSGRMPLPLPDQAQHPNAREESTRMDTRPEGPDVMDVPLSASPEVLQEFLQATQRRLFQQEEAEPEARRDGPARSIKQEENSPDVRDAPLPRPAGVRRRPLPDQDDLYRQRNVRSASHHRRRQEESMQHPNTARATNLDHRPVEHPERTRMMDREHRPIQYPERTHMMDREHRPVEHPHSVRMMDRDRHSVEQNDRRPMHQANCLCAECSPRSRFGPPLPPPPPPHMGYYLPPPPPFYPHPMDVAGRSHMDYYRDYMDRYHPYHMEHARLPPPVDNHRPIPTVETSDVAHPLPPPAERSHDAQMTSPDPVPAATYVPRPTTTSGPRPTNAPGPVHAAASVAPPISTSGTQPATITGPAPATGSHGAPVNTPDRPVVGSSSGTAPNSFNTSGVNRSADTLPTEVSQKTPSRRRASNIRGRFANAATLANRRQNSPQRGTVPPLSPSAGPSGGRKRKRTDDQGEENESRRRRAAPGWPGIDQMNTCLSQARLRGEFPLTTSSPTNTEAVIEDYGLLLRIQEARAQNHETVPNRLMVEAARLIKNRDAALNEEARDAEANGRILRYLDGVEKEKEAYDRHSRRGSSASSPPPPPSPRDLPAMVERTVRKVVQEMVDPIRREVTAALEKAVQEAAESIRGSINATSLEKKIETTVEKVAGKTIQDVTAPIRSHLGQVAAQTFHVGGLLQKQGELCERLEEVVTARGQITNDQAPPATRVVEIDYDRLAETISKKMMGAKEKATGAA